MTANYDMIKKVYTNYKSKLSEVRKVVNRPLTYAEKVLYTHLYDKATKEFWVEKRTNGRRQSMTA